MINKSWERHYRREKSSLSYPDENLVRLLSHQLKDRNAERLTALDMGCGSGRHLRLLADMGLGTICGSDYSIEGLRHSKRFSEAGLINSLNSAMPFKDNSFDIVISWGSLHYSHKEETGKMIDEVRRILNAGGVFLGTLRCERDSYLKRGTELGNNTWATDLQDLSGSVVSFFNLEEIKELFKNFPCPRFGIMERSPLGDIESIISHWFFSAVKE